MRTGTEEQGRETNLEVGEAVGDPVVVVVGTDVGRAVGAELLQRSQVTICRSQQGCHDKSGVGYRSFEGREHEPACTRVNVHTPLHLNVSSIVVDGECREGGGWDPVRTDFKTLLITARHSDLVEA